MLLAWLIVSQSVTTWAGAKTLVLTSPVLLLLAWAGIAALRAAPLGPLVRAAAWIPAIAIAGGALASDALQYHSSNLAPTSRYRELASVGSRFAGRGPALFTDFDEYALYELRDLDIGGPDFVFPPGALAGLAGGYGRPVELGQPGRTAILPPDRHPPGSSGKPAAIRLPPALAGRLLSDLGPSACCLAGRHPHRPVRHRASTVPEPRNAGRSREALLPAWRDRRGDAARRRRRARDRQGRAASLSTPGALGAPARRPGDDAPRAPVGRLPPAHLRTLGVVAAGTVHASRQARPRRTPAGLARGPAERQLARCGHGAAVSG